MSRFTDSKGQDWDVSVNVNTLKRVKAQVADFDLLKVVEDKNALMRLGTDPELMVDVLFAVCSPQAEARGINGEQFAEALGGGDGLEKAARTMLEALADFFPKHRREPLKLALAKLYQVQEKAASLAKDRISKVDLEALLNASLPPANAGP